MEGFFFLVNCVFFVCLVRTRESKREETSLMQYLDSTNQQKWIESSYEAQGPLYWTTMSILLHSMNQWKTNRLAHLRRLIILAHVRHCQPNGPTKTLSDKTVKEYDVYKPYLIYFGLVDGIYNYFFKVINHKLVFYHGGFLIN